MFPRSLRLTHIHGVEVRLSWSLPLFAVLVLWVFGARFVPTHGLGAAMAMSIGGTLLLLASILAHELGHALEARHRDLEVVGITLSMLGGATEMHARNQTARDELAVAAIGPYVSLACAALFGLTATLVGDLLPASVAGPMAEVAGLLGWINVALALLNIVPGAPLDGGRILRAALWWVLGDRLRGLVVAGRVGQALWAGLVGLAVWILLRSPDVRLTWFTAALMASVGIVLFDAARREIATARLEVLFDEVTVGALLEGVPSSLPADGALDLVAPAPGVDVPGSRLAIVTGPGGAPIGLLDLHAARSLHASDRSARTVGELAQPLEDLPTIDADDDLHTLIDRFQGEASIVLVERDARAIAAVTEREVAGALGRIRSNGRAVHPWDDRDASRAGDTRGASRTAAGS